MVVLGFPILINDIKGLLPTKSIRTITFFRTTREDDKVRIQDFDDLYVIKFLTTFFVSCQHIW